MRNTKKTRNKRIIIIAKAKEEDQVRTSDAVGARDWKRPNLLWDCHGLETDGAADRDFSWTF